MNIAAKLSFTPANSAFVNIQIRFYHNSLSFASSPSLAFSVPFGLRPRGPELFRFRSGIVLYRVRTDPAYENGL